MLSCWAADGSVCNRRNQKTKLKSLKFSGYGLHANTNTLTMRVCKHSNKLLLAWMFGKHSTVGIFS